MTGFSTILKKGRKDQHQLLLYGIIITVLFCLLYIFEPPFLKFLDLRFYDTVLRDHPVEKPANDIIIVTIDEKSLDKFGQWPWPRYLTAHLLQKIRAYDPAVVGVDFLFAEADRTSLSAFVEYPGKTIDTDQPSSKTPPTVTGNDQLLAETFRKGPFVLAQKFLFDKGASSDPCALHPIPVVWIGSEGTDPKNAPFYKATGVVCNLPVFDHAVTETGFINAAFDIDGLLRRIPLIIRYNYQGHQLPEYFPSLAMATIMKYRNLHQVSVKMNASGQPSTILLGNTTIPVDEAGNMLIHYRNREKSFVYISAADMINNRPPKISLKGKIVFVGASATGLGEHRITPAYPFLPGVEIHATVAQNILQSVFVKRPSWISGLEFFFVLFTGLLSTILFVRTNAKWSLALMLFITAGLFFISYAVFRYERMIICPLIPLFTLTANFSLLNLSKFWQSERALRRSERQYRSIFDNAIEGICRITPKGRITAANQALAHMLGFDHPRDLFRTISRLQSIRFENPDTPQTILNLLAKEGVIRNLETVILTGKETKTWVSINAVTARDIENMPIYAASIEDISERKWADEALQESQRRLADIIDFLPDATMIIDKDGRVIFWNRAMETMTGVRKEAMLGKGDREYALPFYGERQPMLIDLALHPNTDTIQQFTAIRRMGDILFGEAYTPNLPPGDVHLSSMASVLRDSRGEVIAAIECIRNNTERKRLEERLTRAEKMEALGTMAGGVAHDLNNVLGVLIGYAELMMMKIPAEDPLQSYAEKIYLSGKRGAAIIEDLLTLARRGVIVSDVVDMGCLVSTYFESAEFDRLKADYPLVAFKVDLRKDLMRIKGSPIHLSKTLMNLVSNAAEAISETGEVIIKMENRYLDTPIRGYDEVNKGDYVVLSVSDSGQGISPTDMVKIFEPFYTKKAMGKSGTGLGLAIVWGTVKDHGGYIDVKSEEGVGTIFNLFFPATQDSPVEEKPLLSPDHYMGTGENILVVDDIEGQRQLAASMLTRLNYAVSTVSSGEEAVSYLMLHRADLLVLDMIMEPGIDGLETYRRVLNINPQQKAVIISGYTETEQVKKVQALGAGTFVQKPYALERLGLAVKQELSKP